MGREQEQAASPAAIIIGSSGVRLWGLTPQERLRRALRLAGVTRIEESSEEAPAGSYVLLRADWVYDASLIAELVRRPGVVLTGGNGQPVAAHVPAAQVSAVRAVLETAPGALLPEGLAMLDAEGLAGNYNRSLRKRETPLLAPVTGQNAGALEKRLFAGSYKGTTDVVTKYVWPLPARIVTKWCALAGITPNQVTFTSLFLVILTFWAFWKGSFALGLAMAWVMTFLDTVDGKLARVTLTSTKIGNVFDHGIDLIHPPFWWWAWIVGLGASFGASGLVLALVDGGYVLQRIEEGIFSRRHGFHIHVWHRFDSFFRLITARRNPNLVILTIAVILGRPDVGMIVVAAWVVLCLIIHALRLWQAEMVVRSAPLTSWLDS
ncbi:MAG: CDP-alcohol phosphatidyltransferase family protein [Parvibaculaceae bacterium]|nr:CDP-alcohol phosphatidyltransferase family protein [Parvibaculaceae bacterium]